MNISLDRKLAVDRRATFIVAVVSAIGLMMRSSWARTAAATADKNKVDDTKNPNVTPATQLQDLKAARPEQQVVAIRHDGNKFEVATADGRSQVIRDIDLRIKIDTGDKGPVEGRPVILPGGMMGDRATLFFASPAEISALIQG